MSLRNESMKHAATEYSKQQREKSKDFPGETIAEANAVPVENKAPEVQPLPVFWDGAPGTLTVGMICRQGKLSVQVLQIIPCVNGTVILGAAVLDGQSQMIHVSEPLAHPLSGRDAATPEQRDFIRKLWEYDQQ